MADPGLARDPIAGLARGSPLTGDRRQRSVTKRCFSRLEEGIMDIAITDRGSTATVRLVGRLDIAGAEILGQPLATLSGSKNAIVLDMAEVTFVASIGLRHLVSASKAVRRRGGGLTLLNPNDAVTEVITASGLTELLPIERNTPS